MTMGKLRNRMSDIKSDPTGVASSRIGEEDKDSNAALAVGVDGPCLVHAPREVRGENNETF